MKRTWGIIIWMTASLFLSVELTRKRPFDIYLDKKGKEHIFNSCPCGLTDYEVEEPRLENQKAKKLQRVEEKLSQFIKSTVESSTVLPAGSAIRQKKGIRFPWVRTHRVKSLPSGLGGVPTFINTYLSRMHTYAAERWVKKRSKRETRQPLTLNVTLDYPGGIVRKLLIDFGKKGQVDSEKSKEEDYDEDSDEGLESAEMDEMEEDFEEFELDDEEKDTIVRNMDLRIKRPKKSNLPDAHLQSSPWFTMFECEGGYLCSGVLINRKMVLTSANCVSTLYKIKNHIKKVKAHFGPRSICRKKSSDRGHAIESLRNLKPSTDYEVGLVTLLQVMFLTKELHPICLPSQGVGTIYDNSEDVGIHYGFMTEGNNCSLKSEAVKLIPVLNCPDLLFPTELHKICAFNVKSTPCTMNEGGPLAVRLHDQYVVVGVRIQHPGCKLEKKRESIPKGEPGIYARLHIALLRPLIPLLKEGECLSKPPTLKDLGIHLSPHVPKKKKKTKKVVPKFSIKKLNYKSFGSRRIKKKKYKKYNF